MQNILLVHKNFGCTQLTAINFAYTFKNKVIVLAFCIFYFFIISANIVYDL